MRLALAITILALGPATDVRADIYECRAADGTREFTNVRQPGRSCRVLVRESDQERRRSDARSRPAAGGPLANAARNRPAADRTPDPHRFQRYDHFIREAARIYQLPAPFIRAVMKVESNFNPYAISRAGAQGLMQLMPTVAKNLGVEDPFDPRENIFGGTKLLRTLIDQYEGDINLILAAYNAGGVAVNRYGGIPYSQTRHYVASVYRWYKTYSAQEDE